MHAFCAKVNGQKNPRFPTKIMNLYVASETYSRRTFDFILGNLLGPGLRIVQRENAKMREEIFIIFDKENIKNRLRNRIEQLIDTSDNMER